MYLQVNATPKPTLCANGYISPSEMLSMYSSAKHHQTASPTLLNFFTSL
jgi:hypothetical protein